MKTIAGLFSIILFMVACEKIQTKKTSWPNGQPKEEWEVTQDEFGEDIKNGLFKAFSIGEVFGQEVHPVGTRPKLIPTAHGHGEFEVGECRLIIPAQLVP